MPKTKVTIVQMNGRIDLYVGTDLHFITQPTFKSTFVVDNVFLSILNNKDFHY